MAQRYSQDPENRRPQARNRGFSGESYGEQDVSGDMDRQLQEDRQKMRRAQESIYDRSNITGADLSTLNRNQSARRGGYGYGSEGYSEEDPERGRGRAYREDYGYQTYGQEAYRDYPPGSSANQSYGSADPGRGEGRYHTQSSDRGSSYSGTSWEPSYRGRGPKGYQRSNQRLHEDVCERLTDDPRIDASDIEINVSQGEVTLTGTVDSRMSKRLAEHVAESCGGVKDVHNQLRIKPSEESESAQINM